jgi:hypothetical protein
MPANLSRRDIKENEDWLMNQSGNCKNGVLVIKNDEGLSEEIW